MHDSSAEIITTRENEAAALRFEKAAIALHVVSPMDRRGKKADGRVPPECPHFRATELDMLSYAFQSNPPLRSRREIQEPVSVRIRFPDKTMYRTGGRSVLLPCPEQERKAVLLVSSTSFPGSGLQVWHYVFKPAEGESFTEFDLIKLTHLFDSRAGSIDLPDTIVFDLEGGWAVKASTGLKAPELFARLGGAAPGKTWPPIAGTLEILAEPEIRGLLELVQRAGTNEGSEESRKLKGWAKKNSREASMLRAYCGILTGTLHFSELGEREIIATLMAAAQDFLLLQLSRCTLASISPESRNFDECWEATGVSPQLLIPHALNLHNEALLNRADEAVDGVLGRSGSRIGQLEQACAAAEENLGRNFLPNVFHSTPDRSLATNCWDGRGAEERRNHTIRKVAELRGIIHARWQRRREAGQAVTAGLLALLAALQARELVFGALGPGIPTAGKWGVLGVLVFGVSLIFFLASRWGRRE